MHRISLALVSLLFASCILAAPAGATDLIGGADQTPGKVTLAQGGGFTAYGPASVSTLGNSAVSVSLASGTGLFGWRQGYRIDADVGPNLLGGYTAGVAAAMGVRPGEVGTTYGLKIGAGWIGEGFAGIPLVNVDPRENSDTAVRFSVTQSITPRLSFIGSAEAHHGFAANTFDPGAGASQVVFGAGIGLRF